MRVRWFVEMPSLALAGAWLLVACAPTTSAPSAPAAPGAPEAPTAAAKPEPKYGGILQYSCTTAPVGLNPYVSAGSAEERTMGAAFDTLTHWKHEVDVDYRNDFIVEPWLAERWEQKDATTYILYLRKGVKWHDGQEFTADDVVFSLNYGVDPANRLRIRSDAFAHVKVAEKIDQYTVRVIARGEVPNFLSAFAERIAFMLPKHIHDRDELGKVVVGTGPFIFQLKDYDANKGALVLRNPNYWQAGRPYLDGVRCFYGMQAQHEDAAFVSGQLDIVHRNDRVQLQTLQRSVQGLQHATISVQSGLAILPKVDQKPWDDVRVRKATHLAVDRQALKQAALFGDGIINPPGMPGDKEGWAIPPEELLKLPGYRQPKDQDIAEGKRLLAEAGHAGGIKTTLTYGTNLTLGVRQAEPLQAMLAKIGINATLRPLPIAEARAVEEKGDFELMMQNTADHQMKTQFEHMDANGNAYSGINDQRLTELLYRATRSRDTNEARKAALEMQRHLLETNWIIPTIAPLSFPMWQQWVFDYVYEPSNVNRITRSQAYRVWMDVAKMPADRR